MSARIAPEPMSSIAKIPRSCASRTRSESSGASVNPTIRKLLRCTRRIAAVSGPIARS